MLTEARQDFLIRLRRFDGGLGVLPCPPSVPKAHRFQGGVIYTRMIEIEGQMLAPQRLAGRPIRVWLTPLEKWRFSRRAPPHIGDLYDRTGELPGGGLEASLCIPNDAWLTAVDCLSTVWRRLELTGADGDGGSMRLVSFSFSSGMPPPP
jgi:hypothetical protein